ncbi:MAG TPA: Ig-like domain-containing protein, partial [Azospira sp.]|nr:Ig-like domain-containing protein [Azospira sp.]
MLFILSLFGVGQAQAMITATTITFGSSPTMYPPVGVQGGLNFADNWYSDYDAGGSYINPNGAFATTNIVGGISYGMPGMPAMVSVATAGDRFDISSLTLANPGMNTQITIRGFRAGSLVASMVVGVVPNTWSFTQQPLNWTNIDQLSFESNGDGWFNIDNLVISPSLPTITLAPAAGALSAGASNTPYSQLFSASGGTSYTYAVAAGTLPPGLTLSTAGSLSGTPTTAGTYLFSVKATDASGATATNAYSLTILPALTLNPAGPGLPGATIGVTYNQAFSATGGSSYNYALVGGGLPPGMTLSSSGLLGGTPTTVGSYSFTVKVSDVSTATASQTYTLAVVAPTITVTPTTLPVPATVGTAYSQAFTASGGMSPYTYAVASGSLPAGLTLNSSTGVLSGTPTAAGSFIFSISATDSNGSGPYSGNSGSLLLFVSGPTISLSTPSLTSGVVGVAYSKAFSASGGTAPYVYSLASGGLPPGMSLSSTGTLSGVPTQAGTYNFAVQVADSTTGNGPYSASSGTQTITVAPPTISLSPSSLPVEAYGAAYSQTITASGGVPPYRYSITAGTLPTGFTLSSSGILSGVTTQSGTYSFTVQASDSGIPTAYTGSVSYTLSVNPQGPIAGPVSATVAYNTATPITLNLSGGATASVAVATAASHGSTTVSGTTITYTPTSGYSGTDSFTYTATNATGTSAPATVSITVNPALPVAGAVSATVAYNTATPIILNLSGGAASSVAVATAASHGTTSVSGTTITYTPASGYVGTDSFTYTATNVTGGSAPATVNITVNPALPVAGATSATVAYNTATPITLNLSGGAASSVAVATAASHGTTSVSGATITYTPASGYVGSDSFTYTATNVTGSSAPATVSITVNPSLPVAGPLNATVAYNTATPIVLKLSGGAATSVAVATAASHGITSVSGTTITYTPTSGYSGSDSFAYTATNAAGTSSPATVTITVKPALPVANAVVITVPVNSSNNPVPLNLSGGVASSVAVASAPSHGSVQVSGVTLSYTPTAGYRGTDTFTYTATNVTGTSAPATVTVQVMSRPDPSKDQNVIGLVG